MSNPVNTTNLSVSEELYTRLNEIKSRKNWTFDELIGNLCELEFKNNYIEKINEYEYITEHSNAIFRTTFKKNSFVIEYLTSDGFSLKINDWNIPNSDKQVFLRFINQDFTRCIRKGL